MGLKDKLHSLKLKYKDKKMAPAFNALHTFLYLPNEITHSGSHVRAADDLKRTMNTVIMSLVPCLIFGMFNAGYQHYVALGEIEAVSNSFFSSTFWSLDNLLIGLWKVLPLVIVSYGVGLAVEFLFAVIKGHEVEEGYLVMIGKEVFGGTGMNILNPALTIRAFLFFAYPTWMSGDKVWVHGAVERSNEIAAGAQLDAISGETVLGGLAQGKNILGSGDATYSIMDAFYGFIPGSVGETSALLILLGALFLIFTKIGSWRIMVSAVLGTLLMGLIFNGVTDAGWISESSKFYALMDLDFWKHLIVGGIAFGIVFMATDPVTASQTNKGKWIYGFLIGFISILIRVFNPAYPEGVFLAILLMNVFKKRMKRLKLKTA